MPNPHAKNGLLVSGIGAHCAFCGRDPRLDERYGTGPDDWDHADICPSCWDATTQDPEDM